MTNAKMTIGHVPLAMYTFYILIGAIAMFSALLFDNDGVLVDTEPLYLQATQMSLATVGIPFTEADYIHHMATGGGNFDAAKERGMDTQDIANLKKIRNDCYAALLRQHTPRIDGVAETLALLAAKFPMGIVSSSRREHLDIIMEQTGFAHFFQFIIAREDFHKGKPDPESYLRGIERIGKPAAKILVIEDSERGVLAAKAAGLTCFAIPRGMTRDHNFSTADRILHSIRDIPDALDGL